MSRKFTLTTSSTVEKVHQDRATVRSHVSFSSSEYLSICFRWTFPSNRNLTSVNNFLFSSCREYQNLNALFAIVMGLGNQAVSRLSQTWERLPSKLRRTFEELENLIEPSRNHKRYRSAVAKLQPPLVNEHIPFILRIVLMTIIIIIIIIIQAYTNIHAYMN